MTCFMVRIIFTSIVQRRWLLLCFFLFPKFVSFIYSACNYLAAKDDEKESGKQDTGVYDSCYKVWGFNFVRIRLFCYLYDGC